MLAREAATRRLQQEDHEFFGLRHDPPQKIRVDSWARVQREVAVHNRRQENPAPQIMSHGFCLE